MRVSMNYWEEIDWDKEGSTSPVFLGAAAGAFIILSLLAYISWEYLATSKLKAEVSKIEAEIKSAEAAIAPITKQNDFIKYLDTTIFEDLSTRETKRMIWSRGLQTLATIVPREITLNGIQIVSQKEAPNKVEAVQAKNRGEVLKPVIFFTMTLTGFAQGSVIDAEKTIEQFSLDLLSEKGFSSLLDTAELQGFGRNQKHSHTSGLPFTIVATFKPVE